MIAPNIMFRQHKVLKVHIYEGTHHYRVISKWFSLSMGKLLCFQGQYHHGWDQGVLLIWSRMMLTHDNVPYPFILMFIHVHANVDAYCK